jgi:hypothetical protein
LYSSVNEAFEPPWFVSSTEAKPLPPITAESLPPIRTWKGEKNVAEPPPELARPAVGFVYSKLLGDGTAVIVKVPL